MRSSSQEATMMLVGKSGKWRVRIVADNGLVVENKQVFLTVEEAKAFGNAWCKEHGIRTEIAQ